MGQWISGGSAQQLPWDPGEDEGVGGEGRGGRGTTSSWGRLGFGFSAPEDSGAEGGTREKWGLAFALLTGAR